MRCGKRFRNSAAKTAMDVVVFSSNKGTGFPRAFGEKVFVYGLDGRHVDHTGINAISLQKFRRLKRAMDLNAASHNRQIIAVPDNVSLADFKFVILAEDPFCIAAAGAHVNGSVKFENGFCRKAHFGWIGRRNHRHSRDGAVGSHILKGLCGAAVGADIKARVTGDDLHIAARIGDRKSGLFDSAKAKDGKCCYDRNEAGCSHAAGH